MALALKHVLMGLPMVRRNLLPVLLHFASSFMQYRGVLVQDFLQIMLAGC